MQELHASYWRELIYRTQVNLRVNVPIYDQHSREDACVRDGALGLLTGYSYLHVRRTRCRQLELDPDSTYALLVLDAYSVHISKAGVRGLHDARAH